jgi:catabolite regulation protein CreA
MKSKCFISLQVNDSIKKINYGNDNSASAIECRSVAFVKNVFFYKNGTDLAGLKKVSAQFLYPTSRK